MSQNNGETVATTVLDYHNGGNLNTRDFLTRIYVDWRNNYLTPAKFAEHHGITEEEGQKLIELARSIFYSKHPDQ